MNKEELRSILNQPYQFENWKRVIDFTFPNVAYLQVPLEIPTGDDLVESFRQVGTVRLNDGKNLAMFEVHVKPNVNIARNRVALRNLVAKYIDQERNHGVLAIYEKGIEDYRFTFTAKETDYEETTGNFVDKETEAKRYTYILGAHESCRTARDRFWELSQKKNDATIKDVEAAFSVEKLSKEFFTKYKEHYTAFVNYLNSSTYKISAFNNDEKAIRDFVKILLGRIVFLHFVQKKGWLGATDEKFKDGDQQFMYNLWKNSTQNTVFYQLYLVPLFFDALNQNIRPDNVFTFPDGQSFIIPYLGGGLFERDNGEPEFLTFPSNLFDNLYEFFNEYNFTIDENDPFENEVGIDPEMLGHIFENLLEDNKDKGAFYTPKPIVKYMCQESLIQYFITSFEKEGLVETENKKTNLENKIGNFVRKYEAKDIIEYDHILSKALYNVKICDPAIGSGAFPMGLLNEMVMLINVLHSASPDVVEDLWEMENWQPATVKKHIIQNSIYGVDIEKGAVDIARLRFWLSLIIDEEKPTTLPSLDYKIVVGDSLISKFENEVIEIDWELKEETIQGNIWGDENEKAKIKILNEITDKQLAFFVAENHQKEKLKKEIRGLKIELLINQLQLQIRKQGLDKVQSNATGKNLKNQTELFLRTQGWKNNIIILNNLKKHPERNFNHFDWKLDFPEVFNPQIIRDETGFDIVIGNPPYIQMQKDGGFLAQIYGNTLFDTFEKTGDIYSLFYEKGFRLLKEKGIHTFITSSQWIRARYGKSLRKFFLTQNPLILLLLGPGVFDSAVVDTNIMVAQKGKYLQILKGKTINKAHEISTITSSDLIPMPNISEDSWGILSADKHALKRKFSKNGIPLKKWDIKINFGIKSGLNEVFIIDETKKRELIQTDPKSAEIIKPLLRGREIHSYYTEWDGGYIIATFPSKRYNIDEYKGIKTYLQKFLPKLNQNGETFINSEGKVEKTRKKTGNKWFETQDQIGFYKEFLKEKIIWKRIGSSLRFSYSNQEIYCLDSTCIATGEKIKYLTGLLNSKLCKYQLFESSPRTGMGDLLISVQALEPLLVHYPTINEETVVVALVDEILERKQHKHNTSELENQIDILVYKLYDLCYDEVLVIDPEFEMSEEEYKAYEID